MENQQIRISAKNLGSLALPNCCKRCFYLKLKLNFKLPFQIFPGIFSSIDSYSKKITWSHFEKVGKFPDWFSDFGEFQKPVPVPHWSKYFLIDEETNVKLTGQPDEILQRKDNSYFIWDYKTSKFTAAQDSLLPLYKAQLNSYAHIAQKIGLSPVSGVGLIYYEPITDIVEITEEELRELVLEDRFKMEFSAHMLEVELEPEGVVKPLMREVRRLGEMEEALEAREGCQDCRKLEELVGLANRS